jgi:hypothetical protein
MIQYLYFLLKHPKDKEKKNEVMISTAVKTEETKKAAAEVINFFDNALRFDKNNHLSISDFGAQRYGHRLIYYTKSYLGETVRLTTKIMEIDKVNKKQIEAILKGLGKMATLPVFASYLPYLAGLNVGIPIFGNIVNLFNRDDAIVNRFDLDLYFNHQNVRHLQSGRIVCVPNGDESNFSGGNFELSKDNRLFSTKTNTEYTGSSYFVIQIDARQDRNLESFDYNFGAADLLKETNRGGNPADLISTLTDTFAGYNDISSIREIEKLSVDAGEEDVKEKISALYKSLNPDVRKFYSDRVNQILDAVKNE